MDVLTFETCWAVNSEIIKQVTSSWSIFIIFIKLGTLAVDWVSPRAGLDASSYRKLSCTAPQSLRCRACNILTVPLELHWLASECYSKQSEYPWETTRQNVFGIKRYVLPSTLTILHTRVLVYTFILKLRRSDVLRDILCAIWPSSHRFGGIYAEAQARVFFVETDLVWTDGLGIRTWRYVLKPTKRREPITVIPRLTKIIRSGITFVSRNMISCRFL